ncbi:MAG: hypothetical protein L3J51_04130 [Cocleimonas sp.]|nr:hypothetical protein [Cocleimonas sp.]
MAEGIFIHAYNEVSKRYVILDELDDSSIMYLSEVGSQKPVKDAFAYMRIQPVDLPTWKKHMKRRGAPILHTDIASKEATISNAKESDFSFLWAPGGESVALIYKNNPIAFISLKEKYGFSKAVSKKTPIVNPWNEEIFSLLFNVTSK